MRDQLLEEAARRARGDDPACARSLLDRILATAPNDGDALTLLGLVAQRTGDVAGALAAFERARAAAPDDPARIGNHALALKTVGRFEEAIDALRRALAIRPGAAVTLANFGSCLIAAERILEAEAPLRDAVAASPNHAEAWNNLGVVFARTNRRAEASAAYNRALELRPDWPEASLNLADTYAARSEWDDAERIAAAVLADRPGHPRAANRLAALAEARGDDVRAISIYEAALTKSFSHPVAHNLVVALLRGARPAEALAVAERMLAASPSVTTPLAFVCAALERLGRRDRLVELTDLDRLVTVHDVIEAPGFASLDAFHSELERELRAHPTLTFEPEGLVTRGGRQSADLATAVSPALATLAELARRGLAGRHAGTSEGEDRWTHARPAKWSLTLWGTILSPGGGIEPHIHAPNWLSGVYYPGLPSEVAGGDGGGFAVGLLPHALGGGGEPRVYQPRPSRMILFPSFLWHATLPFGGAEERISFAFDLVPDGIGRPHRVRR